MDIRNEVFEYLKLNPHMAYKGNASAVAEKFDIPGRSARRYCKTFRESMVVNSHINEERGYFEPRPCPFKAAIFDIETTDFSATGEDGWLVCCSILPLTADDPYTISVTYDEMRNPDAMPDAGVLKRTIAELNKYDMLIGHYIGDGGQRGFDLKWLATRAAMYGLPSLRTFLVYDTYYEAKRLGHAGRRSLAFLTDYFNLEGTKTSIYPRAWHDIRSSNSAKFSKAKKHIIEHCELDVEANRQVYYCLYPRSIQLRGNYMFLTAWRGGITHDINTE